MGCVVNGPGESKAANIGISLPGTGEAPNCPVFIDGVHVDTFRGTYEELAAAFQRLIDEYVERKYPRKPVNGVSLRMHMQMHDAQCKTECDGAAS